MELLGDNLAELRRIQQVLTSLSLSLYIYLYIFISIPTVVSLHTDPYIQR